MTDTLSPRVSPLVSVVITTYQHAHYLGQALDSVVHDQEGVHEIIVVDDGSTDRPEHVVAKYPGVQLLRQDNRGLSAARNTGLAHASGDYVLFLDADDALVAGGLHAGLTAAQAHPEAAVVYGAHVMTGPDGYTVTATNYIPADPGNGHRQFLHWNVISMHASALFRREAVVAIGGFDERLRASEDYDLYLRLAARYPVHSHPAVVAAYRIHDSNMSSDPAFMLTATLRVLARQRPLVRGDRRLRKALRAGVRDWVRHYREQARRQGRTAPGSTLAFWRSQLLAARLFPGAALGLVTRKVADSGRQQVKTTVVRRAARAVPLPLRALAHRATGLPPPVGAVRLGDLDRTAPISRVFGYDRGGPVDRYYIESFLDRHRGDIRGRVMEVGEDTYTRMFGGEQVQQRDVLHVHAGNPMATFVGDLGGENDLPSQAFDCVVLTQTLHLIFDLSAAMSTLHRILRPGGVLLATVPCISNIDAEEWGATWYWGLTQHAVQRLGREAFGDGTVEVTPYGNVKAAVTFLHGLSSVEVPQADLDVVDPCYPVVITLRAVKRQEP